MPTFYRYLDGAKVSKLTKLDLPKAVRYKLQLFILLEEKTEACAVKALNNIQKRCGESYSRHFGLMLTD